MKPPDEIGLLGLGLLGSALAARLLAQGYAVVGSDLRDSAREHLHFLGGTAASAPDVVARCDLVFLSLPTHREVRAVLDECAASLRAGQVILDTTTGDPASSVAVARDLAARGIAYLDGTVSGSSEQARAGDITWMVGGDLTAFERCLPVLRDLGRAVFHTGPAGTGATMKLVTNLVLGLNRAALAEGLAFAEALGLDAAATLTVLRASAAYSRMMDTKGDKMVGRDYTPQARLSQHLKDVRLILAAGTEAGVELPLSVAHAAILTEAETLGLGDLDNSALIEVLRRRGEPS